MTTLDPGLEPSVRDRSGQVPLGLARLHGALNAPSSALAAIVVLGLALRLSGFSGSLYGDEISSYFVVTGNSLGRLMHLLSGHSRELSPPLYFVFAWLTEQLVGGSVHALRMISLLSGVATIPLTYLLARWTVGVRAALVAATLVAFSPFLTFYSSEARAYSLMVVLCLLSTLALLKAIRSGKRDWWVAYAVFSCAAMYTHFTSIFVLIAQAGWALVTQPGVRVELFGSNLAAAAGFLPWVPVLIRQAHSAGPKFYGVLEPFTFHALRADLGQVSIGRPLFGVLTFPGPVAVAMALAGVAVAAFGAALRRGWRPPFAEVHRPSPEMALVVLLACAAPVGIALYSSVGNSVWDSRNLVSSWPGFAVLVASLLTRPPRVWRLPALALVLGAFAIGALTSLEHRYSRPNYQAAADYITREGSGPVVDWPDISPGPLDELEAALALAGSSRRHPVLRLGIAPLGAVLRAPPFETLPPLPGEAVAREAERLAGDGRLFLVLPDPYPLSALEATRHRHLTSRPTSGILRIFGAFLGALPARFHPVAARTWEGIDRVTVYVFQG